MKKFIYILSFLIISVSASVNAQWVQVWNGMGQTETVYSTFWGGSFLLAGLSSDGIYKSTNEGLTWAVTSLNNKTIRDLISYEANYYASTSSGIYISNDGTTWTSFGLSNRNVYETALNNNYVFAGTDNYGVYYSSNNGVNWTQSFLNNKSILSLAVNGNLVIAGTYNYGIYYSTDNGFTWNQSHINNLDVERIKFDGNIIYAGTENGIYKSTNNGVNWGQFGLSGKNINDILISSQYIYAATDNYGIYVSTKQGITWNLINEGFPTGNLYANSLTFTNNYIVTGLSSKSTWRRPKSEIGINQISTKIPTQFSLKQNFPNPFNPVTTIKFDIIKSENIKIVVLDALGREIETLVNEQLSPGSYQTTWDASKYSSGIYFYRLHAGDFIETKKMILIK